jgi:hypothetical protein
MKRTCYINQPRGLGDIIICEPICRYYKSIGYEIIYWVPEEYIWIKDYIKYVNFISENNNYNTSSIPIYTEDIIYLPLIFKAVSNEIEWLKTGWLYDKYRISHLDPMLWKTFSFERNIEKEKMLYDQLNLEGKDYILVNEYSSSGKRNLNIESDLMRIDMQNINGFTMLDWCKVIENSKEFHSVSTSVIFPAIYVNHKNTKIYNRSYPNDGTFTALLEVFQELNFKYE